MASHELLWWLFFCPSPQNVQDHRVEEECLKNSPQLEIVIFTLNIWQGQGGWFSVERTHILQPSLLQKFCMNNNPSVSLQLIHFFWVRDFTLQKRKKSITYNGTKECKRFHSHFILINFVNFIETMSSFCLHMIRQCINMFKSVQNFHYYVVSFCTISQVKK